MTARRRAFVAALGGVLAGCLDTTPNDRPGATETIDVDWPLEGSPVDASFEETIAVEGLDVPWDLSFGPDGTVFLTERPNRILRTDLETITGETPTDATELAVEPVGLPDQVGPGEGGVLGIDVHPDYPEPPSVYVYYTADDGRMHNRVGRFDVVDHDVEIVVDGLPAANYHNGGRIAFGPDDHLWICTGDANDPYLTQFPASRAGAVLRVTPEGDPAGSDETPTDAAPSVVAYGLRNPQGIDWLPDGTPIVTDHGPTMRDEVNLLSSGDNYGWPAVRGGPNDDEYDSYDDHEDVAPPVASSGMDTAWAPSGATWYDDDAIPEFENRLLYAGLTSERLYAFTPFETNGSPPSDADGIHDDEWLDGRILGVHHELLVNEFGRIRHVFTGPQGRVYLLTNNRDGRASGDVPRDRDDVVVRLQTD